MKWFNSKSDNDVLENPQVRSVRPPANDMHAELGIHPERKHVKRVRAVRPTETTRSIQSGGLSTADVYDEEVRLNDLKIRARRRLIGASVLLAGAFLVLPWVFDSGRKQTAAAVNVVVPDKNLQFDVKNPRLDAKSNPPTSAGVSAPNDLLYPVVAPESATAGGKSTVAAGEKSTATKANVVSESTSVAAVAPKAATSASGASTSNGVNAAHATLGSGKNSGVSTHPKPSELLNKPVLSAAAPNAQKYAVHIGLVTDSKELNTLLAKLRASGVEPQLKTMVVDGVSKTRVRLGVFDTQEQAVNAASKAKGAAKNPVVIAVNPNAPAAK